jgi:hypothetical protein
MRHRTKIITVLAIFIPGCSDATLSTAPVRGVVEFDGSPLNQGDVVTLAHAGRMGRGVIQPDGSFQISTYHEESGDGAILGPTRFGVICDVSESQALNRYDRYWGGGQRSLIPESFNSPHTSGLAYEVSAGTNDIRITISSDGTGSVKKH